MKTQLFKTSENLGATIIRVVPGIVLFSHGALSMLGWFGGFGLRATIEFLSSSLGLPAFIGFALFGIQFFGSLMVLEHSPAIMERMKFYLRAQFMTNEGPGHHHRSYKNFRGGLRVKNTMAGVALNIDERGREITTLYSPWDISTSRVKLTFGHYE